MGFAVVSWKTQNGVPLEKEEFEAIALAKVIMMNNGKKEKGADVTMVYQKVLWGGTIHSLHDTKKEACDELNKEVPQVKTPVQQKRARKQKDYGDQYVEEISDAENNDETPKSSKGKASKKRQRTAAVDEITEKCDAIIVNEILNPVPPRVNLAEKEVSSDSDRESDGCSGNQPTKLKHPRFGGKQPKKHTLPKCISQDCKKVKLELDDTKKELEAVKQDLSKALDKIRTLKGKASKSEQSPDLEKVQFGKVSREVAELKNWEEIGQGVWCCPIKIKAAIKNSSTRTGLACQILSLFYPKEMLEGRRLQSLDQDIIESIIDFSMVAKLTKEPIKRKCKVTEDGKQPKPPTPDSKSKIRQALRMKCNTLIRYNAYKKSNISRPQKTEQLAPESSPQNKEA